MPTLFKRLNSDHTLGLAVVISTVLHLILFMGIFYQADQMQQSSTGQTQVILLEHTNTQPNKIAQDEHNTLAASQKSNTNNNSGINGKQQQATQIQQKNSVQINSPNHQTQTAQSTSGQNNQQDLSGSEQTAQQQYRQLVTQHLLKKIKNSQWTGSAIIHLTLLKMGIATNIEIELLKGSKSYQTWLNSQVLNANPFPAFPANLATNNIKLSVKINHKMDNE